MARKTLRKLLPHPDVIIHNRWIKLLGPRLQDPSLWHINRRSFPLAVALGIFCAFIPIPFQMLIAAAAAVWIRVNILVAVPMVWISNPVTMGPMYYFCYLVGAEILGVEPTGFTLSLSAFILVRVLWHMHILRHIKIRARRLHNRRRRNHSRR